MRKFLILLWMTSATLSISAQENKNNIELQYTTEGQYNFQNNRGMWMNLLEFQGDIATKSLGGWNNGYFNVQLISIYRSSKERIADDLQVFSNIDAENLLLGIFALGYTHKFKKIELFGGLRNVNRDYLTSPYTSFFTNSSCGVFPTLSANFPIANYPLSAVCIHFEYQITKSILLKNSLYNGIAHGYSQFYKHLFTVSPGKNGIFNITQLSFTNNKKNHGIYSIGAGFHSTLGYNNKNAEKLNYTFWGNIEQNVYKDSRKEIGILLQTGYAPADRNTCRAYYGAGAIASGLFSKGKKDQLGLIVNRTLYTGISETAFEASFSYPVLRILNIQPAFHYIVTGNRHTSVGMLRAVLLLD